MPLVARFGPDGLIIADGAIIVCTQHQVVGR
jgi:hypothetical protein